MLEIGGAVMLMLPLKLSSVAGQIRHSHWPI